MFLLRNKFVIILTSFLEFANVTHVFLLLFFSLLVLCVSELRRVPLWIFGDMCVGVLLVVLI
jgi:hypothetical protein